MPELDYPFYLPSMPPHLSSYMPTPEKKNRKIGKTVTDFPPTDPHGLDLLYGEPQEQGKRDRKREKKKSKAQTHLKPPLSSSIPPPQ
jgi:hypothetical protein